MGNPVTPEFRVSYEHFINPHAIQDGDEPKYSCKVVLDRSNTEHSEFIERMKKFCKKLAKDKWGKVPKGLQLPFTNGDDSDNPEFEGCTLFNSTRKED